MKHIGLDMELRSLRDMTKIGNMQLWNNPWYPDDTPAYVDINGDILYVHYDREELKSEVK